MAKTAVAKEVDAIQAAFMPVMKEAGFRKTARRWNRRTTDGLTHVMTVQLGSFNPPGWQPIPGLREDLYGSFILNFGVYVPEVARAFSCEAGAWVSEYHCTLRARPRDILGGEETWWDARAAPEVIDAVTSVVRDTGLPWLDGLASRDAVLAHYEATGWAHDTIGNPPRVAAAVILAERGATDRAAALLDEQISEARAAHRGPHADFVADLKVRLGVG